MITLKDFNVKIGKIKGMLRRFLKDLVQNLNSKPYVDSPFRNSLAHGTWGIENKKVVLFKNAKLEVDEDPNLRDFMMKL